MIFQFSWEIGQLFSIISNRDNRGLGKGIIRYVSSLRADYLRILIENDWNYEIATSINPNIVNSDFVHGNITIFTERWTIEKIGNFKISSEKFLFALRG